MTDVEKPHKLRQDSNSEEVDIEINLWNDLKTHFS